MFACSHVNLSPTRSRMHARTVEVRFPYNYFHLCVGNVEVDLTIEPKPKTPEPEHPELACGGSDM